MGNITACCGISLLSLNLVQSTGVYCPVEACSQADAEWLPCHLHQESVRIIHSTTPLSRDPHTFGRTNTKYIKYTLTFLVEEESKMRKYVP